MSDKPPIRLKFQEPLDDLDMSVHAEPMLSKTLPSIGTEKLSVKCGHTIDFDLYGKDPFRDGRRQKAVSRDCYACRQARVAADIAAAAKRKATKAAQKLRPRLPDGARFTAVYDAKETRWTGTLTIDGVVFERRASGIRQLLNRLDDAYRAVTNTPLPPATTRALAPPARRLARD